MSNRSEIKKVKAKYTEIIRLYEWMLDSLENNPEDELLEALCDYRECPFNDEEVCVAYSYDQQNKLKDCIKYKEY